MKFETCLEIAKDCNLETVGEALFNIRLHSGNLFAYSEIKNELEELQKEFEQFEISKETKVNDALELCKSSTRVSKWNRNSMAGGVHYGISSTHEK